VLVLCPLEVLCYEYYLYRVVHDAIIICRFFVKYRSLRQPVGVLVEKLSALLLHICGDGILC
jgi:hypothetical protein